jgi:uncharacterized protein YggE
MKSIHARKIAIGTVIALMAAPGLSAAQTTTDRQPTISVTGLGEATISPDMATLSFAVVKQADNAADAMTENSKALAAVMTALKDSGIADRDLQTTNFSVQPFYRQFEPKDGVYPSPEITGYQVSNGVTVRIRDLKKLGEIIDTSVKLGINQGGDVSFGNDDSTKVVEDARKDAVKNAIAKATTLAESAGVKLGRVIEISENQPRSNPQPIAYAAMAKERSDSAPIAAGENSYSVTVNVTFAIDQ